MFMQALRRTVRTLLLPGLLLSGIAASAGDEHSFTNWTQYLGGSDSAQYSSLRQISKANVKQLELAWSYPTGNGTFIFGPIVVDGVMYVLKAGTPPPNAPPLSPEAEVRKPAQPSPLSTPPPAKNCGSIPTWAR